MSCKNCDSERLLLVHTPPHIGSRCEDCGTFQGWIKQDQNIETGEVATEKQQSYALSLMRKWKQTNSPMTARQASAIISAFRM